MSTISEILDKHLHATHWREDKLVNPKVFGIPEAAAEIEKHYNERCCENCKHLIIKELFPYQHTCNNNQFEISKYAKTIIKCDKWEGK